MTDAILAGWRRVVHKCGPRVCRSRLNQVPQTTCYWASMAVGEPDYPRVWIPHCGSQGWPRLRKAYLAHSAFAFFFSSVPWVGKKDNARMFCNAGSPEKLTTSGGPYITPFTWTSNLNPPAGAFPLMIIRKCLQIATCLVLDVTNWIKCNPFFKPTTFSQHDNLSYYSSSLPPPFVCL